MDDFIQDLILYSKKAHKSVMIAAHSILNLVRDMYPALLKKGDRGKYHDPTHMPSMYGEVRPQEGMYSMCIYWYRALYMIYICVCV